MSALIFLIAVVQFFQLLYMMRLVEILEKKGK